MDPKSVLNGAGRAASARQASAVEQFQGFSVYPKTLNPKRLERRRSSGISPAAVGGIVAAVVLALALGE